MNSGAVAIFKKNWDGTWIFTNKLAASDRGAGDHFGYSLDVYGDYVVVGAHSEMGISFGRYIGKHRRSPVYRKIGDFWIE